MVKTGYGAGISTAGGVQVKDKRDRWLWGFRKEVSVYFSGFMTLPRNRILSERMSRIRNMNG
jgi:hypothetical protein